jgi:hypothetical protein
VSSGPERLEDLQFEPGQFWLLHGVLLFDV